MDQQISSLDYESPDFQSRYVLVLNHIHQDVDQQQLKNELVSYSEKIGRREDADAVVANRIGIEGKIAYCLNRGARLAPSSIERVIKLLDECQGRGNADTSAWFEEIPETAGSRAIRAYVSCYSFIDNAKARVLAGKLSQRDLAGEVRRVVQSRSLGKTAIIRQLFDHYNQSYREARADETIASWVKPLGTIAETIGLMLSTRESVRSGAKGAKARKMRSTVDQVDRKGERAAARVSYKDEDTNLGISSVDPTNLVGSQAAVIFNTKNRHCEIYMAKQGQTLSIHGSRIVNFDEAASTGRTLRKPESDLPHWTRASTVRRLEVLISSTNGKKWQVTGKLNKNCVIVKVL